MSTDATHDPALRSWVESANDEASEFPIQNLPFGCFRRAGDPPGPWRVGIAIGDQVLDTEAAHERGLEIHASLRGSLDAFMALGAPAWRMARQRASALLAHGSAHRAALSACLVAQSEVEPGLPCRIGDYTDFYTGIHHATTVGKLFRPDNPLLPNYKWVPIGYHGRSSTIRASGHAFHRPMGQLAGEGGVPRFAPSQRMDHELEIGVFVGADNPMGEPRSMGRAEEDWFGLVLLNDWSARDVQSWEYQPLGPFLSKNFATTISPWIVTRDALAPYRVPFARPEGDPQPLPYLDSPQNRASGALDITLEVWLQTPAMASPHRLTQCNFRDAYWTIAQLVAHHTSNGCAMRAGDLLGSGTQSGPQPDQGGSLLELTQGGRVPIALPNGETRGFLQDGDTVILKGHCERPGWRRIGFGECRATLMPAKAMPG